MIKIHQAKIKDLLATHEVTKLTWLDTYPNKELGITVKDLKSRFPKRDIDEAEKRAKERLKEKNSKIWVAYEGDVLVGYIVARKEEGYGYINALYILPEFQLKGIGKKLMKKAMLYLKDFNEIKLGVASYNDKAIKFYEHFGFLSTNNIQKSPAAKLPSGKVIPEVEMVRTKNN